jgi:hypothetical protein
MLNLRVLLLASLLTVGASDTALAGDPWAGASEPDARPDERCTMNPSLRSQMTALRSLVEARFKPPLTTPNYRVLGAAVKVRVKRLMATCVLPPAAQAAFHPILAELLAGAAMLAQPSGTAHVAGMGRMHAAFDDYARRFSPPSGN